MKKRKQKHMSKDELIREMNMIAKESRMATNSPWTAMGVLCCYTMMVFDGWKSKRLQNLMASINGYEDRWQRYEIDLEPYQERLMSVAGWKVEQVDYTEADISAKKGTFSYAIDKFQINAQNEINRTATRFLTWFYNVLIDNGYGEKRLEKVLNAIDEQINRYRAEKHLVAEWQTELLDSAGLVFEQPIDPKTKSRGSVLC